MTTKLDTESPLLKPVVTGTGTANEGKVGPALGKVDIGASEKAYIFQVALPGVHSNLSDIKCGIRDDGRVKVEGSVIGSGVPKGSSVVFEVKVQELCPPGRFSISFNLPGPVDPRLASLNLKEDGILEVIVMKYRIPYFPEDNHRVPCS